jgi:hypothetical protein
MEDDVTNRASPDDRPELHNPSIDEDVARQGACGLVHLPTGNTCTLAHHHTGSCDFVPPADVPHPVVRPAAG